MAIVILAHIHGSTDENAQTSTDENEVQVGDIGFMCGTSDLSSHSDEYRVFQVSKIVGRMYHVSHVVRKSLQKGVIEAEPSTSTIKVFADQFTVVQRNAPQNKDVDWKQWWDSANCQVWEAKCKVVNLN